MKQISERAKELIENLLRWSTAPHEGEWEFDEWGRPIGGFPYVDMAQSELEAYIADLEAENRALRHSLELRECEEMEHKPEIIAINSEQDYKSALAEVSRLMNAEPGSEDEARLVRLATLVDAYEDARYPIPDESDPLKGVQFVLLSNAEIAAMTPEHPLYKLVHGKEGGDGQ